MRAPRTPVALALSGGAPAFDAAPWEQYHSASSGGRRCVTPRGRFPVSCQPRSRGAACGRMLQTMEPIRTGGRPSRVRCRGALRGQTRSGGSRHPLCGLCSPTGFPCRQHAGGKSDFCVAELPHRGMADVLVSVRFWTGILSIFQPLNFICSATVNGFLEWTRRFRARIPARGVTVRCRCLSSGCTRSS